MSLVPLLRLFGAVAFLSFARGANLAAAAGLSATPAPFLSPLFGDNMVLQRGKPNAFWGWTDPGRGVRLALGGRTVETTADATGKWSVRIEVPAVGGPYTVTIDGPQSIVLHNVLVGDVWLCGGQSNMFFPLRDARGGRADATTADQPQIRLYTVASRTAYAPVSVPRGEWKVCTPVTADSFSAVAYYFARELQRRIHVPIGVIQDCVGGSPAESWMSAEGLAKTGEFAPQLREITRLHAKGGSEYGSFLMHWLEENDPGAAGEAWAKPNFDDSTWKWVGVPGGFAELGVAEAPSVCWFRREIVLSTEVPNGAATIFLGSIEKMDTTYVNGRWIGASSWVENPRAYSIPAGVLQPGRNVIALRVFKLKPTGGFLAKPETLRVQLGDGASIPLAGKWRAIVSVDARPPHPLPLDFENYATMPTVLYNGMIAPVAPLAIAGAVWYQGEANTKNPPQYRKLLPALIADWRAQFQQGDLPFFIVSLPAFMARRSEPGTDGWAEVREVQAAVAATVPNAGLAVTIDTGDPDNIHPIDKKIVGERLAWCALAQHYGVAVPFAGPTLRTLARLPGALKLQFDHTEGGLVVHGEKLAEFAIAGEDRVWHWAEAKIDGDAVLVSASTVPVPVAARYAWQANPAATLFNAAGLPAGPFRTDDWPLSPAK